MLLRIWEGRFDQACSSGLMHGIQSRRSGAGVAVFTIAACTTATVMPRFERACLFFQHVDTCPMMYAGFFEACSMHVHLVGAAFATMGTDETVVVALLYVWPGVWRSLACRPASGVEPTLDSHSRSGGG